MNNQPKNSKASPVERSKLASHQLRGSIDQTLLDEGLASFEKDDVQTLKFHGIYQQDDRDARVSRKAQGQEKAYSFMVRVGPPGGVLSADQYLSLDRLADLFGNGSLRLTSRQGIQFHGVHKDDLRRSVAAINQTLLTTFGACGDVPRNILAPPAPFTSQPYSLVRELAAAMAVELKPRTQAYHQIWVNPELTDSERKIPNSAAEEPFYGSTYLPRKFKIALALSDDNSVDVYTHDLAFVGLTEHGDDGDPHTSRFVVLAGGGLGMTHNKPETIARMATPLGVVTSDRVVETARAVVALHRDLGDRANRRHARLKYLLEDWGVEVFRGRLEERLGWALPPAPADFGTLLQQHHLGAHAQGNGKWFYGLPIQSGRVADTTHARLKSALRTIATRLAPSIIVTPMQGLIFGDLTSEQIQDLESILHDHGIRAASRNSPLRALSMACPALPTCGLALAESERVHGDLLTEIERLTQETSVADRPLIVRMTGCPNGCARPYNADIGLVGRKPGHYHLYIGGNLRGDSLGELYAKEIGLQDLAAILRPLFEEWRDSEVESFGDFFRQTRSLEQRGVLSGAEQPLLEPELA